MLEDFEMEEIPEPEDLPPEGSAAGERPVSGRRRDRRGARRGNDGGVAGGLASRP